SQHLRTRDAGFRRGRTLDTGAAPAQSSEPRFCQRSTMSSLETAASELLPEIGAEIVQKAAGSSFYSAMRLMPKAEREAMLAIYAFCRAVDDIADSGIGSRAERHEALSQWRRDLDTLYDGGAPKRTAFLSEAVQRYGLR